MRTDRVYFSEHNYFSFKQYVADQLNRLPSSYAIHRLDTQQLFLATFVEGWECIIDGQVHGEEEITYSYFKVSDQIYFSAEALNSNRAHGCFYFHPNAEEQVKLICEDNDLHRDSDETVIFLLTDDGTNHEFTAFSITPHQLDLGKHFNSDFTSFHESLIELTKENNAGLVFLNGIPGTGKTTYLQYLASVVDREFLFVTPGMGDWLASSNFNSLMSSHSGSVLIIEDAEHLLSKKGNQRTAATSNLLNLTDGILSACFKTLVICTFNCDLHLIDEALTRPGRLRAQYEFDRLSEDRVYSLTNGEREDQLTLAEIYNLDQYSKRVSKKIGFN